MTLTRPLARIHKYVTGMALCGPPSKGADRDNVRDRVQRDVIEETFSVSTMLHVDFLPL